MRTSLWFLSVLISLISCEFSKETNFKSNKEVCEYFRGSSKTLYPENSKLGFGEEPIEPSILVNNLFFTDQAFMIHNKVYRKGCFIDDRKNEPPIYYFKYGIIKNDSLKELRIRSIQGDTVIDDKAIIRIDSFNDDVVYDYFISDEIHVIATNDKNEVASSFYNVENGSIHLIDPSSEPIFSRKRIIEFKYGDEVIIYNVRRTKQLELDSLEGATIKGEIVKFYGGKGYGDYAIIKLQENHLVKQEYISVRTGFTNNNGQLFYYPSKLIGLNSDKLNVIDYATGDITVPASEEIRITDDVFIEHATDL